MYCKNCGTELRQGDLFCMNCGQKVDLTPQNNASSLNRNKIIAIVCVAVAVVVIIAAIVAAVIISNGKNSDEDADNGYSVTDEDDWDEDDEDYEEDEDYEDEEEDEEVVETTTEKTSKKTTKPIFNPTTKKQTPKSSKLSESDIRAIADDEIGNVAAFEYHDYDKNGTYEAFVVSATMDEFEYCDLPWDVYFINSEGNVKHMYTEYDLGFYFETDSYYEANDSHGFFGFDKGGYGSGWKTDIYSVKNNQPKKLSTEGFQGFYQKKNGTFYTTQNDFANGGGHSYPEYELIYNSSSCEFSMGSKLS